jgi:hypothetical protein
MEEEKETTQNITYILSRKRKDDSNQPKSGTRKTEKARKVSLWKVLHLLASSFLSLFLDLITFDPPNNESLISPFVSSSLILFCSFFCAYMFYLFNSAEKVTRLVFHKNIRTDLRETEGKIFKKTEKTDIRVEAYTSL